MRDTDYRTILNPDEDLALLDDLFAALRQGTPINPEATSDEQDGAVQQLTADLLTR